MPSREDKMSKREKKLIRDFMPVKKFTTKNNHFFTIPAIYFTTVFALIDIFYNFSDNIFGKNDRITSWVISIAIVLRMREPTMDLIIRITLAVLLFISVFWTIKSFQAKFVAPDGVLSELLVKFLHRKVVHKIRNALITNHKNSSSLINYTQFVQQTCMAIEEVVGEIFGKKCSAYVLLFNKIEATEKGLKITPYNGFRDTTHGTEDNTIEAILQEISNFKICNISLIFKSLGKNSHEWHSFLGFPIGLFLENENVNMNEFPQFRYGNRPTRVFESFYKTKTGTEQEGQVYRTYGFLIVRFLEENKLLNKTGIGKREIKILNKIPLKIKYKYHPDYFINSPICNLFGLIGDLFAAVLIKNGDDVKDENK